jgi:hypothetical protein
MRTEAPTKADIRRIALALEGVKEVDHWKRPAFRTTRRIFAVIRPDGLWLNLPDERKEFLFEADPNTFVKYMWGKHPELIAQYDKVPLKELKALIVEAHAHAAPPAKRAGASRAAKKRGRT